MVWVSGGVSTYLALRPDFWLPRASIPLEVPHRREEPLSPMLSKSLKKNMLGKMLINLDNVDSEDVSSFGNKLGNLIFHDYKTFCKGSFFCHENCSFDA